MSDIQAKLAILDDEIGAGLCSYLLQHPCGLTPVFCSTWNEVVGSQARIGLVQAALWDERQAQQAAAASIELFLLEERDFSPYQPADALMRELYRRALEKKIHLPGAYRVLDAQKEIVAVCSPHGYDQQTGFAVVYSLLRAEQSRTLYLDFTYYNGFFEPLNFEDERDVGDLFYELHKQMQSAGIILEMLAQRFGALAYVPPVRMQMDLEDLTGEDFTALLQRILQESDYELFVLNLPMRPSVLRAVFDSCSRMYSLQREGTLYDRAQTRLLDDLGVKREQLADSNLRLVFMPPISGSFSLDTSMYEELLCGEMAAFIRERLREEFQRGQRRQTSNKKQVRYDEIG